MMLREQHDLRSQVVRVEIEGAEEKERVEPGGRWNVLLIFRSTTYSYIQSIIIRPITIHPMDCIESRTNTKLFTRNMPSKYHNP
jgi:hypothetical protein